MVNYHFTIKTDTKPDGHHVKAAAHAQYINRTGRYQAIDEQKIMTTKYRDIISGNQPQEKLPEQETLIYSSPYGNIKFDAEGVRVSHNASIETVAVALAVAQRIYGDKLSVSGGDEFRAKNIRVAAELDLPLQFREKNLATQLNQAKKERDNERREFINAGGKFVRPRVGKGKTGGQTTLPKPGAKLRTLEDVTQRGFSLPQLPTSNVDGSGGRRTMLLSANERRHLVHKQRELSAHVRWDNAAGRKRVIERTADDIMVNLRQREKTHASSHAQYINREAAFQQRGGCVYAAHHLPKWAKGDAQKFFAEADLWERANGERYKEIEMALPNILDLEAQKEIVETFIEHHLKNFYYAYAIHDKIGAMSNGERHPHVHIMFSTRELDEAERTCERPPKKFFARTNTKEPAKGGCRKADKFVGRSRRAYLCTMREDFAAIQNQVLAKHGINLRVDHRSLKAQRQEALMHGNKMLAEILDRLPQKSVGPRAFLEKDNPMVAAQKRLRALNRNRTKAITQKYLLEDMIRETKATRSLADIQKRYAELNIALQAIPEERRKEYLTDVKLFSDDLRQAESLKEAAVYGAEAIEKAKLDCMTGAEKEDWQRLKDLAYEKKQWEQLCKTLGGSDTKDKKELAEVERIKGTAEQEIKKLDRDIRELAKTVQPTFDRLRTPLTQEIISQQSSEYISSTKGTKYKLEQTLAQAKTKLEKLEAKIRDELDKDWCNKPLTAGETADLVAEEYRRTEDNIWQMKKELKKLEKKIISPARALYIAKDVYTQGGYKKIRQERRALEKKYKLGQKITEAEYQQAMKKLDDREAFLDKRCGTVEAAAKIREIAAGILRKNAPAQSAYQQLKTRIEEAEVALTNHKETHRRLIGAARQDSRSHYRVQIPPSVPIMFTPERRTSIIAAALSGNEKFAQLVARAKPDEPDEWRYLSETEKEDLKSSTANLDRY